jgi:hypothetical protein
VDQRRIPVVVVERQAVEALEGKAGLVLAELHAERWPRGDDGAEEALLPNADPAGVHPVDPDLRRPVLVGAILAEGCEHGVAAVTVAEADLPPVLRRHADLDLQDAAQVEEAAPGRPCDCAAAAGMPSRKRNSSTNVSFSSCGLLLWPASG